MLLSRKYFFLILLSFGLLGALIAQDSLHVMLTMQSPFEESGFSTNIVGNGDLNGDGYNDWVLAKEWTHTTSEGVVNVYLGGATPDTIPDYVITGNYFFGRAISFGGDLNDDGFDDLVIGAPDFFSGEDLPCGKVYIYWGGASFDTEPDVVLAGSDYANISWGLMFGSRVNTHGDFNGDGINDLVVSSLGPSLTWNGQVDIFYGNADFDTQSDWQKQGQFIAKLGTEIAVGNLNGDAYDDLAISWNECLEERILMNRISIFTGSTDIDTVADCAVIEADSHLGPVNMYMSGDLNSDGCDDLVFAQLEYGHNDPVFGEHTRGYNHEMQLVIMSGNIDSLLCEKKIINRTSHINNIFFSNCNNDSYDDLCLSMESVEQYWYQGVFQLFYSSTFLDTVPDVVIAGENNHEYFGRVGYNLGDINGDDCNDIILGSCGTASFNRQNYIRIYTSHHLEPCEPLAPQVQASYSLYNYPNPFNPETTIDFSVPQGIQNPVVEIYNVKGQKIRSLPCRQHRSIRWDGRNQCAETVASGVYFYRVQAENYQSPVRKMLLLK